MCELGSFVQRLAEWFIVIRYDEPRCGLLDRDGIDLSFDAWVAAALAVADAVGAGRLVAADRHGRSEPRRVAGAGLLSRPAARRARVCLQRDLAAAQASAVAGPN